MVVSDLFVAGTDTTQTLLRWALLFLANEPTLQQQIYEEISENIGDRIATQDRPPPMPFHNGIHYGSAPTKTGQSVRS